MCRRQLAQRCGNTGRRFGCTARCQIDVNQHMLARGQQTVTFIHAVEQVHFLTLAQQYLRFHPYPRPGMDLVEMADMGFGGEIAAPAGDIV